MAISIQYETLEEADMRLRGTVIYYEGEPVFVYKVSAGKPYRVHFVPLPLIPYNRDVHGVEPDLETFRIDGRENFVATEKSRKYITSKNLDYGVSKVGFVSMHAVGCDKAPVWVGRSTDRQYRQGLTSKNCSISIGNQAFDGNVKYTTYDTKGIYSKYEMLLMRQSFKDSLMGANTNESKAIGDDSTFGVLSDNFCWYYSKDFKLKWLYSCDFTKIGVSLNGEPFSVPKRFGYYRDQLIKDGISFVVGKD